MEVLFIVGASVFGGAVAVAGTAAVVILIVKLVKASHAAKAASHKVLPNQTPRGEAPNTAKTDIDASQNNT